ncbi:unnamed protein product [Protopolystoma xenopodis]|uniref:Peptidase M41 domain-containing protein n=1 Tax=Protopolystoma xenopodis TaxID=117903 RepID=A0A448XAI5_9PLAT|nr:unnamed protein product [Protopolystoma xenopodis]
MQSDSQVRMDHLWDARDRVLMGPKRQLPKDQKSNQIAAFHEAGHAIAAIYTPGSTPLHKVTIIPRGKSGGHTSFLDEVDTNYQTRQQLIAQLDVAMGGRVGEELVFGSDQVTTGASNDFEASSFCI